MNKVFFPLALSFIFFTTSVLSQKQNSELNSWSFDGSISITNNGISIVPAFSLEQPAYSFDLRFKKNSFTIEPVINFSYDGKPWFMLFWLRKTYGENSKFKVNLGTHYGLNYVNQDFFQDASELRGIKVDRYAVFEVFPHVEISKNFTLGTYYLQSHGLNEGTLNTLLFVTLFMNFSSNQTKKGWKYGLTTQPFYLRIDDSKGWNLTSDFYASKAGSPFLFKTTFNKTLNSNIEGSKAFLWNISLTYNFKSLFQSKT